MIYIDFILLIWMLVPPLMQQTDLLEFFKPITSTVETTQDAFYDLYNSKKYELTFNGQVIYLEKYLNDQYDPLLTRIYIETNDLTSDLFLFNTVEANEEVYVFNNSEFSSPYTAPTGSDPEQVYVYSVSETINFNAFTVYVPVGMIYDAAIMRKQIDAYRLPGKQYNIVEV